MNEGKGENEASCNIQRRIRGILARKHVERMREEEMEFLGMCRKKKTPADLMADPEQQMLATMKERRNIRMSYLA